MFYRLLVMFELFIAEFMLAMRLSKRKYFALRFAACVIVGEGLAAALPLIYNSLYTSFTFLLLCVVTVPMMWFCCAESWQNVFFCVIAAYTMQHLAYGVANFCTTLIKGESGSVFGMYFDGEINFAKLDNFTVLIALVYCLIFFVMYVLFYYIFIRRIKRGETFRIKRLGVLAVIGVALVIDILLNSVIVYYSDGNDRVALLMNMVYESLCCGFLLYIQFGLIKTGALRNELDVMQYLLRENERQYKLSKDNIELINLKCHDLRHQIRSLGKEKDLPKSVVSEIEKSISIYDATVRTDNEVLDTILTEKSLICARDRITLTCVADGHALDFMEASDVYSIFGNALDNAIDAVLGLPEERRCIGLVLRRTGDIVSVNINNPYDGEVKLDDEGYPITKKPDKDFHGIGIRSICRIAEKYNGICSVSLKNNTFILNILLSDNSKSQQQ